MNEQEIIKLFTEILEQRSAGEVLGVSRHLINNYRNKDTPKLGTMLELLFKAGKITITANGIEGGKE